MECAVCYTSVPNCKLVCGHAFCMECVKKWYHKGTNEGCPMCRKKLYFKRMPIKKWKREAEEEKKNAIYEEAFDDILEMIKDDEFPSWLVMDELVMMEKTYNFLKKCEDVTEEDLDYLLNESGDYFSDRKTPALNKTNNFYGDVFAHEKKKNWETKKNISGSRAPGFKTHRR